MLLLLLTGCAFFPELLTEATGPCAGYRTEALAITPDGRAWMGCGVDLGLFMAGSVRASYEAVSGFEAFHVFALTVDGDVLWVAGDDADSSALLYRLDLSQPGLIDARVALNYSGSAPFMRLSAVENLAVSGGRMLADSLTGNELAQSEDGGDTWEERYLEGYQVSHLQPYGSGFAGTGSTIAQPPVILLPSEDGDLEAIELTDAFTGEVQALAVLGTDDLIAVGSREDTDEGLLYRCTGACADAASWEITPAAALGVESPGKLWSIHFAGQEGIAVGEHFPQGLGGYALWTTDGGQSWRVLDGDLPILTLGLALGDGQIALAGGAGFLAAGRP